MAVERFEDEHLETLQNILARLDVALSALRDSLRGGDNRSLTDVYDNLQSIINELDVRAASPLHGQVAVGTTATQLPDAPVPSGKAVVVKAPSSNTKPVYIGGSGVTTANGFELSPGEGIRYYVDNANRIYVVAEDDAQKVCWTVEG